MKQGLLDFENYKKEFSLNKNKRRLQPINIQTSEEKRKRTTLMVGMDCYQIGDRWGEKLTLHRLLLEEKDKLNKINNKETHCAQFLDMIMEDVLGVENEWDMKVRFGEIGRYMKVLGNENKYISLIGENNYIYFINLELLGDYASSDINEASQGLDDWLLKEKDIIATDHIKELFYNYFDKGLSDFFQKKNNYNYDKEMTWDSFLKEPDAWSTMGSAGKSLKYIDNYQDLKGSFVNNKKIFGILVNKETLAKKTKERKKQYMKVNIKRELVKSRGVVNSDVETYLHMAYISYLVQDTLYGNQNCTLLLKSNNDLKEFNKHMFDNLNDEEINLPLDQSAFDARVNMNMIHRCYNKWKYYCKQFSSSTNDIDIVFEKLDSLLFNGDVIVGKDKFDYKNGIPSGWRWTSIFDSAINYAECKAIEHILNDIGVITRLSDITVQGDDVQCNVNSKMAGEYVIAFFDMLGLQINRRKMFISGERSEYLRLQYYINEGKYTIRGIPPRCLPTLFYRSPITSEQMSLNSLLDQWLKIIRRYELYESKIVFNMMIKDCLNFLRSKLRNEEWKRKIKLKTYEDININEKDIKNYLFTPSIYGGYGMGKVWAEKLHLNIENKIVLKEHRYLHYKDDEVREEIGKKRNYVLKL